VPEAVIVDAVRTAVGKRGGALASYHPVDLAAEVLKALVRRNGVDPGDIDDVIFGCVTQFGDQAGNVARFAVLAADWPETIPGVTVNRACGSGQQAVDHSAQAVIAGQAELVVAGGVESMTRVPLGATRQTGLPYGPSVLERYGHFDFNQGISAEMVAERWDIPRLRLDEFSVESHTKAAAAIDSGAFTDQIVPIDVKGRHFDEDEGVRRDTSVEQLARLAPAFKKGGRIHAGNSSQISDGAAALLVTTPERARAMGLAPIVRYRGGVARGHDPVLMLSAPIEATHRLLQRTELTINEIDLYEVNEAFASVPLAWLKDLSAKEDRLNVNGGAIALGHPLGASGAILMTRLIHEMRVRGARLGLQTMCEAGGTANATLVELVG